MLVRTFNQSTIYQASDGYINATEICKANGKLFADYLRLDTTQAFLAALSLATGIPVVTDQENLTMGIPIIKNPTQLIRSKTGRYGGTWVHPKVAIHLGQWCSPEFAVQITEWVFEWMTTGKITEDQPPSVQGKLPSRSKLKLNAWIAIHLAFERWHRLNSNLTVTEAQVIFAIAYKNREIQLPNWVLKTLPTISASAINRRRDEVRNHFNQMQA